MRAAITALMMTLAAPALAGEVAYQVDGADFEGYFAKAENAKGLVLIVHDWDGLTGYERKRADMLAALGYDAFALDLYGAGERPDTLDGKKAASGALYKDRARMRALLRGGVAAARAESATARMVVMGYCFGGAATLEMARAGAQDVAGYVSFHGGLATPEGQSWPQSVPPLLIAHGGADKAVSMGDVATLSAELEAVGAEYDIEVYSGAPHAFTVFGSDRYREGADRKSWATFKRFLAERLGG